MPHFTGMDPASPLHYKSTTSSSSKSKTPPLRLTAPAADSIRILVSTDNHVGYMERDGVRHDDSWKSFDEVMGLAKEHDVDMVLLAGDLFHENKPSRKSMYQVMQSLRANTLGDKPCELQMLSDGSEHFAGSFNHVNTLDQDINVAIPVFSIHGNHDDPSGEGNFAALDILAMSGLINYYGRTPESDNIEIKPVLIQKGKTKLALYGMSNVRDERLFRTFRDGKVKFFQPSAEHGEWFNIMSVHQNHHAYTETSYLPEQFLPSFMDLIVWGHEHECKINPTENPEMGFHVMQPGSSIATSLVKGEAEPKQVAIVTVTGTDFDVEPIRLKSVRPFVIKEIILQNAEEMKEAAFINDNRTRISTYLEKKIRELIEEANQEWYDAQVADGAELPEGATPVLPLIRLRVESTPPEGGKFDLDNPQRFSNKFHGMVANTSDVIQFHRKKRNATRGKKADVEMPDMTLFNESIDSLKVDKLVKEFLGAQSLTILPQNSFTDAVDQFVHKDDKDAMEEFVTDSLKQQVEFLGKKGRRRNGGDEDEDEEDDDDSGDAALDDDDMMERIAQYRMNQEEAHAKGELRRRKKKGKLRPKPSHWDSEDDGHWEDNALAWAVDEDNEKQKKQRGDDDDDGFDDDDASVASAPKKTPARGRGSRGGRGGKAATGTTRKTAATTKKAPAKGRGKKKQQDSDEDEDEDIVMADVVDDDDEDESQGLFVSQAKPTTSRSRTQRSESPVKKAAPKSSRGRGSAAAASSSSNRQTQLNFGGTQTNGSARSTGTGRATASRTAAPKQVIDLSDDEISDDDAFEPPPAAQRSTRPARR
ncbi:hypothetical protein PRZ48_014466 [Zasmidium cellare]|uniref:Double-strand break repair protein n=1 Tax=Zasmidium cellare TaxID=395010 RepID=A0ABR0DYU7_ZASCE|nr:hypothetical protein PRZ48_014466 [Zasmidium cellare]